jgi:hypothetical protein
MIFFIFGHGVIIFYYDNDMVVSLLIEILNSFLI